MPPGHAHIFRRAVESSESGSAKGDIVDSFPNTYQYCEKPFSVSIVQIVCVCVCV